MFVLPLKLKMLFESFSNLAGEKKPRGKLIHFESLIFPVQLSYADTAEWVFISGSKK